MAKNTAKESLFNRIRQYVRGVRLEMKKVTWPTKKEVTKFTIIVIVLTVALSLIMGLADLGLQQLFYGWL